MELELELESGSVVEVAAPARRKMCSAAVMAVVVASITEKCGDVLILKGQ